MRAMGRPLVHRHLVISAPPTNSLLPGGGTTAFHELLFASVRDPGILQPKAKLANARNRVLKGRHAMKLTRREAMVLPAVWRP